MSEQYSRIKADIMGKISLGEITKENADNYEAVLLNYMFTGAISAVEHGQLIKEMKQALGEVSKAKKEKTVKTERSKKHVAKVQKPVVRDKLSSVEFSVHVTRHDIHYKEQLWQVPERDLTYVLSLITNESRAARIYKELTGKEFSKGIRMFEIVTYDTIPTFLRSLGFLTREGDRHNIFLSNKTIDDNKLSAAKINKALRNAIKAAYKGESNGE